MNTNIPKAQTSLQQAQALLERVEQDNARLAELVAFLPEALDRARELTRWQHEQAEATPLVIAESADADTPPVADEDSAWEALVAHDEAIMKLLRLATAEVTAHLDVPRD